MPNPLTGHQGARVRSKACNLTLPSNPALTQDQDRNSHSEPIFQPLMVVYPDLAAQLGLDEAVFIAQLDYWLKRSKNKAAERKANQNRGRF